ncbi:MAG: alpha-amylase family glycosyl hydrolase, partial [Calditrichota bacterium]
GTVEGIDAEYEVAGLAAGGVVIPLLSPQSPHYNSTIHNRLHFGNIGGPTEPVTVEVATTALGCFVAVSDLESALGNYQTAWQFTCASLVAAGSADGYCHEVTAVDGGIDGTSEPDIYDVMFMQAADIQYKMAMNYGLSRRMTLDAAGRGLAAISPEDIGPNVAHPGPLCRILTRGAPTIDTTQTVVASVTSSVALAGAWLTQNGAITPATMAGDSFVVPVILTEGENRFEAWAVDVNGDTGRSPVMTYTLVIEHAPRVSITTRQEGLQGALDASATTDPEGQIVSYQWVPDPGNPVEVTLSTPDAAVARFAFPAVSGEYYFNLTASDPDQHSNHGRTLFTIRGGSYDGFGINEAVDWVMNAIIYEIYPRSFSATGDLPGITADLQRLADMGVNCLWLMPIFEGPSDHGYEITDYYRIEQDYGTEQDLRDLVQAAHERGIRIILDMVLNHTGIGHPFMQDCLRYGRYSHYWNYYDRDASGNYTYYYDWLSLPNLNLNNPETVKYFIDMCVYWVEEFDIDGYRCDVAWGPQQRSPQFWVDWRRALKTVKPECLLLAEAGANDFAIFDNRFDLAFDWNLHHEGGSAFSRWFPSIPGFDGLTELITNYNVPWPAYKNPLRFLENHDEDRFISLNTPDQTKLAASFYLTIPGAVMLYAGQEVGTSSQRGTITWTSDPNGMNPHYYRLVQARKQLPALREGDWARLTNNSLNTCYSYARFGDDMEPCLWIGNFASSPQTVRITIDPAQLGLNPDSSYVVSELLAGTNFTTTGTAFTSLLTSLAAYQSKLWVVSDSIISVDAPEVASNIPDEITLHPAYPNPFNPTTTITFDLNSASVVSLKIYDILGREVTTLANGAFAAGTHRLTWDAAGDHTLGSGIYFAVFSTPNQHRVQKLVLLR